MNSRRRGFTLVELLIVIAIIGALVALLLPAIQAARERARQTTCSNNQRQVSLAMFNKASSGKGTIPGWAYQQKLGDGQSVPVPWTVSLLAQLEQQTLLDQMLNNVGNNMQVSRGLLAEPPVLEFFQCPSNASTNPKIGMLHYVVNSGMPDPQNVGNLSQSDLEANGVCHDQRFDRKGPVVQMSNIKDGARQTLFLSENIHRDDNPPVTWLGQEYVYLNHQNSEQAFGMTWVYDQQSPLQPPPNLFAPIGRDVRTDNQPFNSYGSAYARPAAAHPEIFIVSFCDGSVDSIATTIEYRVYQQLMTPNGQNAAIVRSPKNVLIEKPNPVFMTKPLSDADY